MCSTRLMGYVLIAEGCILGFDVKFLLFSMALLLSYRVGVKYKRSVHVCSKRI